MKSYEVLRDTIQTIGAKSVASDMNLSSSLIYKWCQESDGDDAAGAANPLDRLWKICLATDDISPIIWLCEQAGGFFTKNPEAFSQKDELFHATHNMVSEFSDVLEAVTKAYDNENRITPKEAEVIRKEWEELKIVAESFVVACERGMHSEPSGE